MLYGLKAVDDHPCFKMQELLNNLFFDYVFGIDFKDDVFPANFTKKYIDGHGKKFKESLKEIREKLPKQNNKKKQLYSQFVNNNSIKALCQDSTFMPEGSFRWTNGFGKSLNDFMLSSYANRLDLAPFRRASCKEKPTHRFYKDFINKNGLICPFCGLNSYRNKFGNRREDLDHYLYKGKYPLAAVNMWNLIPTCAECNQDYKKTEDVLFDGGVRIEAYYPYDQIDGINIKITVNTAISNKLPNAWAILILPNSFVDADKVRNWNRVYAIEIRYKNELALNHDSWMMDALLERDEPFSDINAFKKFMISRAKKERSRYKQKLQPKAFLKKSFFVYVARKADDAFIGKYMFPFNAGL